MDDGMPQLVMIPGMGTDHRLFVEQLKALPNMQVLQWVDPEPTDDLARYAQRLAEQVDTSQPYVLGGVSMGGMLALELAHVLEPKPLCVALVASCRDASALPGSLKWMEWAFSYLPMRCFQWMRDYLPPPFLGKLGPIPKQYREAARAMYLQTPIAFFRWAGSAIMHWNGVAAVDVPVYHLHGDNDCMILSQCVQATQWIPSAGHMPTYTHPQVVTDFLKQCLVRHVPIARSE